MPLGLQDLLSRPLLPVVGVISALVVLVVGGHLMFGSGAPMPVAPPQVTAVPSSVTLGAKSIVVHVSGAVRSPGLVTLPPGARVAAAIAAAGGARRDANIDATNLAMEVHDGEQVHVPAAGEAGSPASFGPSPQGIDVNAATAPELEMLPGIGPVLAARIVAHRDANGPFETVEDLLDVPGIGEAKLAQLREAVRAP